MSSVGVGRVELGSETGRSTQTWLRLESSQWRASAGKKLMKFAILMNSDTYRAPQWATLIELSRREARRDSPAESEQSSGELIGAAPLSLLHL